MSAGNGNGRGPSTDILGSLGISYPDVDEPVVDAPDDEMDARVREVAARARAQAPVTTRRLGSLEAAPSEAKGAGPIEQAGPAPVLSPPPASGESARPAVPPPATPAAKARKPSEATQIAAWRRDEIVDWVREQGAATVAEIKDHFDLGQSIATSDMYALRAAERLRRTGKERVGPRGGRPSPEFCVPELDDDLTSHARTGDAKAEQPATEAPSGDAADDDRKIEEGHTHEQGDAAAATREAAAPTRPQYLISEPFEIPLYQRAGTAAEAPPHVPDEMLGAAGSEVDEGIPSVDDEDYWRHKMLDPDRPHVQLPPLRRRGSDSSTSSEAPAPEAPSTEQPGGASPGLSIQQDLAVRYLQVLINWIARGQTGREQGPPEHVYDRIERLLGIEEGVA